MAEFSAPTQCTAKGVRKRKVLSTRVDLTPMVDLGFLLITFFIFTTSMSEPKSMKLKVPDDRNVKDSLVSVEGKTLSLVLGKDNQLWYYPGKSINEIRLSNYASGISLVISEKKKLVARQYGDANELVILIKPTKSASFENVVDVLDEMLIHQVTRYVLMDPSADEVIRAMK
jgi:biopolymer transport protein ExbD